MRINEITLQPYRNFDRLSLSLKEDRILIVGKNGRGKSNLLEAISYLSIGKSIRGAQDVQAVPHQGQYFDIEAVCEEAVHVHRLRIYFSKKEGKRVFCDRTPLPRIADIIGQFKSVHFSPEDVSLVLRFPAQRRRLLDILISQASPSYLRELQQYQRVLTQRNALLRTIREARYTASNDAYLGVWNEKLAQLGGTIRQERLQALQQMGPVLEIMYERFAQSDERAEIVYRWSGQSEKAVGCSKEKLIEELGSELDKKKNQEIQQGFTLSGPHRDQLSFSLNGLPADIYASEGQLKTILIAWKMAETEYLKTQTQQRPVLLLDDLFSELDKGRIAQILGAMELFEQVVLTTPQEIQEIEEYGFCRIEL